MAYRTVLRVSFSDLDPYNHVNHARYLSYFETARIDLLEQMDFSMSQLAEMGLQIVLVEATIRYFTPARLGDEVRITTRVREVKRASTRWSQVARVGSDRVATLEVKAAFTNPEGKPQRTPRGFAEAAAPYRADD
ncbi:MAG: acyl-CoA thioesterase [Actinomycetia bacterium]|nr:acyl-CoA thioesterase [Actinomycetes bacterium]